ncbi:hypothetical protein N7G274_004912 [Stereocaulon virgatum]|uniref:SH3 domain-containing protein n=1 Tax=Stereocaulon virgatum TaxID=373712 RepID=A0ABR4ABE0_9LECA
MHHNHAGHQHHHADIEKRQENPGTVVQYVYKTAAKTFDGPIGGYVTENAQPASTPDSNSQSGAQQAAQQQAAAGASSSAAAAMAASASAAAASENTVVQPTSAPAATKAAKNSATSSDKKADTSPTKTPAAVPTSSSVSASSPTPSSIEPTSSSATIASQTAAPQSASSSGMSGGGKAGLAIGLLLLIGALLGLAFFIYRRRKSQTNEEYAKADDEKSAYAGGLARSQSSVSTRTTATAPRLSLRPVTEFHPELASRAAAAGGAAAGAAMARNQQNDPANPFGNHAAVQPSQKDLDEKIGLPIQTNAENPFADNTGAPAPTNGSVPLADAPAPLRIRTPSPETAAVAGAGAAAAGVGALAGAKMAERNNAPKPLSLTPNRPVTPAGYSPAVSEFSQTPMSPGAMANGPPPSNVHRIQLDFKPSMDDELGLRAGQLVRLLHEYDDGWALCIRLDRSQQGVAPRTCLSARPVKPRPPPGARGPGPRGPPPPGMMGPGPQRPSSPANGRGSPSPNGRNPRSMAPGPNGSQQRSMSPGPYGGGPQRPANIPNPGGKRRSNSASDVRERRMSPPGPSPMNPNMQRVPLQQQATNAPDSASITSRSPPTSMMPPRKPVPGQAI